MSVSILIIIIWEGHSIFEHSLFFMSRGIFMRYPSDIPVHEVWQVEWMILTLWTASIVCWFWFSLWMRPFLSFGILHLPVYHYFLNCLSDSLITQFCVLWVFHPGRRFCREVSKLCTGCTGKRVWHHTSVFSRHTFSPQPFHRESFPNIGNQGNVVWDQIPEANIRRTFSSTCGKAFESKQRLAKLNGKHSPICWPRSGQWVCGGGTVRHYTPSSYSIL